MPPRAEGPYRCPIELVGDAVAIGIKFGLPPSGHWLRPLRFFLAASSTPDHPPPRGFNRRGSRAIILALPRFPTILIFSEYFFVFRFSYSDFPTYLQIPRCKELAEATEPRRSFDFGVDEFVSRRAVILDSVDVHADATTSAVILPHSIIVDLFRLIPPFRHSFYPHFTLRTGYLVTWFCVWCVTWGISTKLTHSLLTCTNAPCSCAPLPCVRYARRFMLPNHNLYFLYPSPRSPGPQSVLPMFLPQRSIGS
jgi:hypothetical protein